MVPEGPRDQITLRPSVVVPKTSGSQTTSLHRHLKVKHPKARLKEGLATGSGVSKVSSVSGLFKNIQPYFCLELIDEDEAEQSCCQDVCTWLPALEHCPTCGFQGPHSDLGPQACQSRHS